MRRTDHLGKITVYACVPQRISTVAPLSEVILSGDTVWIRTSDGGLWLAPSLPGRGLSWGYSGAGPNALALLLDRLLDEITGGTYRRVRYAAPGSGIPPGDDSARGDHKLQSCPAARRPRWMSSLRWDALLVAPLAGWRPGAGGWVLR